MKNLKIIIGTVVMLSSIYGGAIISGFGGYADEARIIVQWNTTAEDDVAGFQVQRSTDGNQFHDIGFLNAQGQGSGYTFIDDSIIAKVAGRDYFYRLVIMDNSGESVKSKIITIQSNISSVNHTWGSLKALFK